MATDGDKRDLDEATAPTAPVSPLDATSPGGAPANDAERDAVRRAHPRARTATPVGQRIGGRYQVLRVLGMGGMGAVYLALDEVLGKEVALKFVHPDLAGGTDGIARLRDEVLLAQRVTHRNVCRTYDLEEVDGSFLVKMEYVAGETLSWRIAREKRLAVADALAVAREIAQGLAAAHAEGVVHCDLKPANIILEAATGRVVLMDFGIARATQKGADAPTDGASGTPEYMAPEQARGERVDGRADLYSLGCVLYHLLVGEVPYPAATRMASIVRHLTDEVPDARARRPEVPGWLVRVIRKLLAKHPALRYPDAGAVLAALAGPRRVDRFRLARRLASVAAAVALVALGWRYQVGSRRRVWRPVLRELLPAFEENADSPVISPDGTQLAYTSDRDGTWRLYVQPLGARSAAATPSHAVTPRGAPALYPRWTRDGRSLLYGDNDRHVYRIGVDGGAPELVAEGANYVDDCGGGRYLLTYAGASDCPHCQRLVLRDPTRPLGERDHELLRLPLDVGLDGARCDRSGRLVTYSSAELGTHAQHQPADVWVVPVAGGPPRALTSDRQQNTYPTFHPDGRTVVFSSARGGTINLWEVAVDGQGAPAQISFGEGPDLASDVSPDGRRLVFDNDITSVPLFAQPLDGGGERRKVTRTLDDVATARALPDGRRVLLGVSRQGRSYVVVVPLGDGEERVVGEGTAPTVSLDGRELLYVVALPGGRSRIVAASVDDTAAAPRTVTEVEGHALGLAESPDGALHFNLVAERSSSAWRVAASGGAAVEEAGAPWVRLFPAPAGGWRLAHKAAPGGMAEVHVLAPGRPLEDAAGTVLMARRIAWAPDGRSVVYWTGTEVRRLLVEGGEERALFPVRDVAALALTVDGKTVLFSQTVGHVRRQVIENFADRK